LDQNKLLYIYGEAKNGIKFAKEVERPENQEAFGNEAGDAREAGE